MACQASCPYPAHTFCKGPSRAPSSFHDAKMINNALMSMNYVLKRAQVDIPFKDPSTYNFFTSSDLELKLGS